jgi:hypothetical protein
MITIQGVRINDVRLTKDPKNGEVTMTGSYSLISSTGKVLANQDFNGYNGIKIVMNADSLKTLETLVSMIQLNIESQLGLEE